jgi:CRISPR-associated protein Cmr2
MDGGVPGDGTSNPGLLLFGMPGVQRFVGATRTTRDLWAASRIRGELIEVARRSLTDALGPGAVVLPSGGGPGGPQAAGVSNRLVAVAPVDELLGAAVRAAVQVRERWRAMLPTGDGPDSVERAVGGLPIMWVIGVGDTYGACYQDALEAWQQRRRVDAFAPVALNHDLRHRTARTCPLCAADAADEVQGPGGTELRCPSCAAKLTWRITGQRFPSTSCVASAPFRKRVLDAASHSRDVAQAIGDVVHAAAVVETPSDDQVNAVPGLIGGGAGHELLKVTGHHVYAESWDTATLQREHTQVDRSTIEALSIRARRGIAALGAALGHDDPGPSDYYCILRQDGDNVGRLLTRLAVDGSRDRHRALAEALAAAAVRQVEALETTSLLSRVVYAGGDDLLALTPVEQALGSARAARDVTRQALAPFEPVATASTGLAFVHRSYPLASAMQIADEALKASKRVRGKDAVTIIVARRGGERARVTLPWERGGRCTVDDLGDVVALLRARHLSGGLLRTLSLEAYAGRAPAATEPPQRPRQRGGLSELDDVDIAREIERLAERHTAPGHDVAAVTTLLRSVGQLDARAPGEKLETLLEALVIARFIASEGH